MALSHVENGEVATLRASSAHRRKGDRLSPPSSSRTRDAAALRTALRLLTPRRDLVAAAIGLNVQTLKHYGLGRRSTPHAVLRTLAHVLREHGDALHAAAEALEG